MSIIKNVSDIQMNKPHIIINTNIPWIAHHVNTVILGSSFEGHVFLKTKKNMYHLGDASGLTPPIMLGHLYKQETKKIKEIHTSDIVSVVIRRLQNKKVDIPDVQPLEYEKLARSAIWSIVVKNSLMDKWVEMEKRRISTLFDYYSYENISELIYPMIKSKNSAMFDVEKAYVNGNIIPLNLPSYDVFKWVVDVLDSC